MDVAKFILSLSSPEDHEITNMKLQKLLYFAQGLHLAKFESPLYADDIQAWKFGPVIPAVYEKYNEYGRNVIPRVKLKSCEIDQNTQKFIQDVFRVYNQYSGPKLSEMTHRDGPWKTKSVHYAVISKKELKQHFSSKVGDFFDELDTLEDNKLLADRIEKPGKRLALKDFWNTVEH